LQHATAAAIIKFYFIMRTSNSLTQRVRGGYR